MKEAQIIKNLKKLGKIEPTKDWLFLTREKIVGAKKPGFSFFPVFSLRPALVGITVVFVLFGLFGFAQNTVPGDFLYPIKKAVEKSQSLFVEKDERPGFHLDLAQKRLDDLSKIAKKNQVKKLAPAIEEFQANLSQAAKSLAEIKEPQKALAIGKEIALEIEELKRSKEKIEAYGIVIGETGELENALASLVEREIKDLEKRSLNENQREILEQAKEDFQRGDYSQALEKLWQISNP